MSKHQLPPKGLQVNYRFKAHQTALLAGLPAMVHIIDLEGQVVEVSDLWLKKMGYERQQVIGRNISDFMTESSFSFVLEHTVPNFFETGWVEDVPYDFVTRDGGILHVLLSSTAVRDEEGRVVSALSVITDISEQQKAQRALAESEANFRLLAEMSHEAILLHDHGRLVFANDQFYRLYGYRPSELEGKDAVATTLAPQSRDEVRKRIAEHSLDAFECLALRKDGTVFPIEVRPSLTEFHGKPVRVAVIRDLSEQKKIQAALAESEAKFRGAFNCSAAGVSLVDMRGIIVEVNPAVSNILGYARDEMVGNDYLALSHPEDRDLSMNKFREMLRGEVESYSLEKRYLHKDGHVVWGVLDVSLVRGDGGEPLYTVVQLHDITDRKRAEEELRRARNRFQQLSENIKEVFWIGSPDWEEVFYVSPPYEELWGRSCQSLLDSPRSWFQALPVEDREKVVAYIQELQNAPIQAGTLPHYRVIRPNGTTRWIAAKYFPIKDASGRVYRVAGIAEDITERKWAEDALKESEEKYRLLFENAEVLVSMYDRQGRCLMMNKAIARLLGGEPKDFLGGTIQGRHPDHGEEYLGRIQKVIDSGQPASYEDYVSFPSGDHWLLSNTQPVRDADGNIYAAQIISQDITEHKLAEQARMQTEALLNDVGKIAKIGGWEMDLETRAAKWTQATYEIVEIKPGRPIPGPDQHVDYYLPEYRSMISEAMRALIEEDRPLEFEAELMTAKGNVKWCRALGRAQRKDGKCVRLYGTFQDISERKRAEMHQAKFDAQLRQAQKMEAIGTLAGGIAHDFNNMLAAIMGYAELLSMDLPDSGDQREFIMNILTGCARAKQLVRQILSFSRQTEHEKRLISLRPLIKENLKMLRATIPTFIEIRQHLTKREVKVMADPVQMQQVVMNLCANAAQAMEQRGGVLTVSLDVVDARREADAARLGLVPDMYQRLVVSDTGPGMDQQTLERIFDPFFTTKEVDKGTGMGLAVAHGIITNHGGSISAESQPDKGSSFYVYLPLAKDREHGDEAQEACAMQGHGEHVLFVDDEKALVEIARISLTRYGFKVTAVISSRQALNLIKADPYKYHVLITDYTMPELTGLDLAKRVHAIREDLPIILCSGYNEKFNGLDQDQLGLAGMVTKPLSASEMARLVRQAIDR